MFPSQKDTHHQQVVIGEASSGQSIAAFVVEIHVVIDPKSSWQTQNKRVTCILKVRWHKLSIVGWL